MKKSYLVVFVSLFTILPSISEAGYSLTASHTVYSPTDATTVYFGDTQGVTPRTIGIDRIYFPEEGHILNAEGSVAVLTLGSSEVVSVSVDIYDSAGSLVGGYGCGNFVLASNPARLNCDFGAIGIAVQKEGYFQVVFSNPTWVTNPTQIRTVLNFYIETMCGTTISDPCYTAQVSSSTYGGYHEPVNYGDWMTATLVMIFLMAFIPIGLLANFFKVKRQYT